MPPREAPKATLGCTRPNKKGANMSKLSAVEPQSPVLPGEVHAQIWERSLGAAAVDQNTRTTRQMAAQDQQFSDLERSLADAARLIGESKREIKRSQGLLQDQEFRTPAAANPGPRGPEDGDRGSVVRERS
jgi:hypothetical protein